MNNVISFSLARKISEDRSPEPESSFNRLAQGRDMLNQLFSSLVKKENQRRFRAFPEGYCREYVLVLDQIHAITDLDILRLLELGTTIANIKILTATYGMDFLDLCAEQTGKTMDEVKALIARH